MLVVKMEMMQLAFLVNEPSHRATKKLYVKLKLLTFILFL
jgi:hypothetical protein